MALREGPAVSECGFQNAEFRLQSGDLLFLAFDPVHQLRKLADLGNIRCAVAAVRRRTGLFPGGFPGPLDEGERGNTEPFDRLLLASATVIRVLAFLETYDFLPLLRRISPGLLIF